MTTLTWNTNTDALRHIHGPVLCRVRDRRVPVMLMISGTDEHPCAMLDQDAYGGAHVEMKDIEGWINIWLIPPPGK